MKLQEALDDNDGKFLVIVRKTGEEKYITPREWNMRLYIRVNNNVKKGSNIRKNRTTDWRIGKTK